MQVALLKCHMTNPTRDLCASRQFSQRCAHKHRRVETKGEKVRLRRFGATESYDNDDTPCMTRNGVFQVHIVARFLATVCYTPRNC